MSFKHICIAALMIAASATAISVSADPERPTPPAWLEGKLKTLPKEKREFLLSDKAEGIVGSWDKLLMRLKDKNAKEIEAYADGMMELVEAGKFKPGRDLEAEYFDTSAEGYNNWKLRRPAFLDPKREPGPINLSYYQRGGGGGGSGGVYAGGIATFAGAPVAVYPEDLVAGKVDVAMVGAPLDMGSGYRGAKGGPNAMRSQYGAGGIDMYTLVDPSAVLNLADAGDIAIDNMSTERSVQHVRERVAQIARTGAIPFIIGGDHSLEYADTAGLADVHGKASFGVVHFDSHYDAGRGRDHFLTHGAPVYRTIKEGHVAGKNYIQVGLRGPWPSAEGFEWMRNNGIRYHAMPEIEKNGWAATMERALKEAREGNKKLYVSFDVDVLDPAFEPGTGTPVPGGLTMREAIPIVRRLCAENDLVGFEIVELAPILDPTYRSALNANFIMHACLTGVAMRKKGISDPNYLSPLTTDHGQPGAYEAALKADKAEKIDPNFGPHPKPAGTK